MIQNPRRCVFCWLRPADSGEHLISDWIRRRHPRFEVRPVTIAIGPFGAGETITRNEVPFDWKVPCVCRKCNRRWLNNMETRAQPHMWPLIVGEPAVLDEGALRHVAAWLFKTVCIYQQVDPRGRVIPEEHYAHLYHVRKQPFPPPRVHIWLAYYNGTAHSFGDCLSFELIPKPPNDAAFPRGFTGYGITFCLGKLIAQVFGSFGYAENLDVVPADFGFAAAAMVPIWPRVDRVSWPPQFGLDDAGFDAISRAFSPDLQSLEIEGMQPRSALAQVNAGDPDSRSARHT